MAPGLGVCVVVPTYNERENILHLVDLMKKAGVPNLSVLIIDDHSPDGTGAEVERIRKTEPWVRLMTRPGKMGIGSAYQDGFRSALEDPNTAVVVEMDADLQHPPSSVGALVQAVEGGADVAVASRYVPGGSIEGWGLWRRTVSKGANVFARTLLGLSVKDCTSGFRAYSRSAAEKVIESRLPAKGFEFQVATLKLLKGNFRVVEVPYNFSRRAAGESKLGAGDVLRFVVSVLRLSMG